MEKQSCPWPMSRLSANLDQTDPDPRDVNVPMVGSQRPQNAAEPHSSFSSLSSSSSGKRFVYIDPATPKQRPEKAQTASLKGLGKRSADPRPASLFAPKARATNPDIQDPVPWSTGPLDEQAARVARANALWKMDAWQLSKCADSKDVNAPPPPPPPPAAAAAAAAPAKSPQDDERSPQTANRVPPTPVNSIDPTHMAMRPKMSEAMPESDDTKVKEQKHRLVDTKAALASMIAKGQWPSGPERQKYHFDLLAHSQILPSSKVESEAPSQEPGPSHSPEGSHGGSRRSSWTTQDSDDEDRSWVRTDW